MGSQRAAFLQSPPLLALLQYPLLGKPNASTHTSLSPLPSCGSESVAAWVNGCLPSIFWWCSGPRLIHIASGLTGTPAPASPGPDQ